MAETDVNRGAQAVSEAAALLEAAGCEDPRGEAELIVATALEVDVGALAAHGHEPVPEAVAERLAAWLDRRCAREPLEYITGRCAFRGLDLSVDHRVLIPVSTFGALVDAALTLPTGARVHDVGTGSGAIALAIKHERSDLAVSGSDLSPAAVSVARANAARLELDVPFSVADGLPAGEYTLVTANLPWQDDAGQTLNLGPETTDFQPHVAVYGGPSGLEVLRSFIQRTPSGTTIATSCAPSQVATIRSLLGDPEDLPGGTDRIAFVLGRVP